MEEINEKLDLRGVLCPLNLVKAKIKLEEMEKNETLEIILDDGEAMLNVPRSLKEEGYNIIEAKQISDNAYKFLIKKGEEKYGG